MPFTFEDVGERQLKNEQAVRAYRLHVPGHPSRPAGTRASRITITAHKRWIVRGAAAFLVLLAAEGAWWASSRSLPGRRADDTEAPRLSPYASLDEPGT
jgi:hypothetical protein